MDSIQNNENKTNLYMRVQSAIKTAKLDKYISDKEKIAEEGITFLGGLTGKNSLQIEKLKNVKLKIELLQTEKLGSKSEFETEDLLADLFACAISELSGKFSPEMEQLYKQLKEKSENENKPNSDEYIYELACKKIDNSQKDFSINASSKTELTNVKTMDKLNYFHIIISYFCCKNKKAKLINLCQDLIEEDLCIENIFSRLYELERKVNLLSNKKNQNNKLDEINNCIYEIENNIDQKA